MRIVVDEQIQAVWEQVLREARRTARVDDATRLTNQVQQSRSTDTGWIQFHRFDVDQASVRIPEYVAIPRSDDSGEQVVCGRVVVGRLPGGAMTDEVVSIVGKRIQELPGRDGFHGRRRPCRKIRESGEAREDGAVGQFGVREVEGSDPLPERPTFQGREVRRRSSRHGQLDGSFPGKKRGVVPLLRRLCICRPPAKHGDREGELAR